VHRRISDNTPYTAVRSQQDEIINGKNTKKNAKTTTKSGWEFILSRMSFFVAFDPKATT
jgi:hypothetical protein